MLVPLLLKDADRPPHLRLSQGQKSCGNCGAFHQGKCRMFEDYPVHPSQVCDDWVDKSHTREYQ